MRIFCLLPTLNPYGGVISVVNLLNLLVDQGHAVTLASTSAASTPLLHPRTEPVLIESNDDLADWRGYDVLVATSWQTVEPIAEMGRASDTPCAYFVQDYEPDFYPDDDARSNAARSTYDMIGLRIVKTSYLAQRLIDEGGWSSVRIPPGMDLDIFYPRQPVERRPPSVVAMARPNPPAEHRGYDILQKVFANLGRHRPDVTLRSFGNPGASFNADVEVLGRVQPSDLPGVYSTSSIYLDVSRAHGFGRTGIEAMACGTASVLSDSGGINEYAVHESNCLIVPVEDPDAATDAVCRLLDDENERQRLARSGLETAATYSDASAAAALLEELGRIGTNSSR